MGVFLATAAPPCLQAVALRGCVIFDISFTHVAPHLLERGVLHVHLMHATNLKAADRNGLSDPYVKLSLWGQQHKSKTIKKTLEPKWDETFKFVGVLRDLISERLQLRVMDDDLGMADDWLGAAAVDLSELGVTEVHLAAQVQLHLPTAAARLLLTLPQNVAELSHVQHLIRAVRLSTQGEVHLKITWRADKSSALKAATNLTRGRRESPHVTTPRACLSPSVAEALRFFSDGATASRSCERIRPEERSTTSFSPSASMRTKREEVYPGRICRASTPATREQAQWQNMY